MPGDGAWAQPGSDVEVGFGDVGEQEVGEDWLPRQLAPKSASRSTKMQPGRGWAQVFRGAVTAPDVPVRRRAVNQMDDRAWRATCQDGYDWALEEGKSLEIGRAHV